jgi:hypothetical protein
LGSAARKLKKQFKKVVDKRIGSFRIKCASIEAIGSLADSLNGFSDRRPIIEECKGRLKKVFSLTYTENKFTYEFFATTSRNHFL